MRLAARTHTHSHSHKACNVYTTQRAPVARSIAARERQNGDDAKVDADARARARHSLHFRALSRDPGTPGPEFLGVNRFDTTGESLGRWTKTRGR